MTDEDRRKGDEALGFFTRQHDEAPTGHENHGKCGCTVSWTLRELVAWWEKLKNAEPGGPENILTK